MRVCVVGAGYMGLGIAQVLALAGATVALIDVDAERTHDAVAAMHAQAQAFEARGLFGPESAAAIMQRSCAAATLTEALADTDLVVEAVFEDRSVKQQVFRQIEQHAPRTAIIASNTSSIPIGELACVLEYPNRALGMHWFNPPQFVPGVEVIAAAQTDPDLSPRLIALLREAGKWPVAVRDSPGFVANRLQFALFREAALMVEEGVADAGQIDEVVRGSFGYRLPFYGPFAIADMAGLDVYAGAYATLHAAFGDRFSTPPALEALTRQGRLGIKSGGGFLNLTAPLVENMLTRRDVSYARLRQVIDGPTNEGAQ
jgi:3-hydroxybutyryl-CoA dehydrogenase